MQEVTRRRYSEVAHNAVQRWMEKRARDQMNRNLGVKRIPDPVKKRAYTPRIRGTTAISSDVGVVQFWCSLFQLNEQNAPSQKMTDATIHAAMEKHYPVSPGVQRLSSNDPKRRMTVNAFRRLYNAGRLDGNKPEVMSFRYNMDGQPVDGRTGKRLLRTEDVDRQRAEHARQRR